MTVERKRYQQKPEKKKVDKVDTRKLKRGFKTDLLPDAIIECKFVGEIGCEIVVNRFRDGRDSLSICTVKQIDEKGLIHTWDETLQHWFTFPVNEPPKLVKLFMDKQ
jgi:hypothetical protein